MHTNSASLPKWTTNIESELTAIKSGVQYAIGQGKSALIISDSKGALQSLNSYQTQYKDHANEIIKNLILAKKKSLNIQFMWVPSHVGIVGNEKADALAKAGSDMINSSHEVFTTNQFKTLLKNHIEEERIQRMDAERPTSSSIKHYDTLIANKHTYGTGRLYQGACDRIAARIRLGYRHPWEIEYTKSGRVNSEFSKCVLCKEENSNSLSHYIVMCPKLSPFRPEGKRFIDLCLHFCQPEHLLPILALYPGLKM